MNERKITEMEIGKTYVIKAKERNFLFKRIDELRYDVRDLEDNKVYKKVLVEMNDGCDRIYLYSNKNCSCLRLISGITGIEELPPPPTFDVNVVTLMIMESNRDLEYMDGVIMREAVAAILRDYTEQRADFIKGNGMTPEEMRQLKEQHGKAPLAAYDERVSKIKSRIAPKYGQFIPI